MYSKKMVKQKVDKINTLNQQINQESTFDGKLLLDNQIKNIFGEFTTEPLLKKGIEKTNKGKRVERVKIIQKQQRGDFTPLHPSPLRKSILNGGRKKRVYGGPSPKRTKSLFKKKRTKKKKRVGKSPKTMKRVTGKKYLIFDNGGRPYKVVIKGKGLDIYTYDDSVEDINYDDY